MSDPIIELIAQDNADRQRTLNKKSNYTILAINDSLPEYVNSNLFDNFIENSSKCQDAIIEKFYRHLNDKNENFTSKYNEVNEKNLNVINAILDLTKSRNIKEFSYLISLLNNINEFILENNSGFGYTTNKFLKNNINFELLRRFIVQDQEDEDENFAKYIFKFFFGFNANTNEADYYLDNKNNNFEEASNTTALSTLINLVNVYLASGFIHSRIHSRNKFLSFDNNPDRRRAKTFVRDTSYANICYNYKFLYSDRITEREDRRYRYADRDPLATISSFVKPNSNFFITKDPTNFNVFKNIGQITRNNNYILLDNENLELISSRTKELLDLDTAFESINEEYQLLIKPLISSNNNAAVSLESQFNGEKERSISKSSYSLANKYLYDVENNNLTLFIENVKYDIGQAKKIFTSLYNKKNKHEIFDEFLQKTFIENSRSFKDAVVLSNSLANSLLVRSQDDIIKKDKDKLFNNGEIDFFESNNKISSPKKGLNNLNLLNETVLNSVIELHAEQKNELENKIDSLFEENIITSSSFFEKVLKKSTEGIRNSLTQIQANDEPYIEYFPSHLLEEISLMLRFNSNKNHQGNRLSRSIFATRKNFCKLFYESALNNSEINRLSDFYTDVIEGNELALGDENNQIVVRATEESKLAKFINENSTDFLFNNLEIIDNFNNNIFNRTGKEGAENALRNLGIDDTLINFVKNLCNPKVPEVDFSKLPIDVEKVYQHNNKKIPTPRYYQTLGHIFSTYYTTNKQENLNNINFNINLSKFFYVPFFGFLRGQIKESDGKFLESEPPFNLYPVKDNNIFSQMKTSEASNGIVKSFIDLLKEIFSKINREDLTYNDDIEQLIFHLFKSYSQLIITQLSNLFEYSTLLHIPKMISEGPLDYNSGLRLRGGNASERSYARKRKSFDGEDSSKGGLKSRNFIYPPELPEDITTDKLTYCNVKDGPTGFQPSQGNIERYLNLRGIKGYYTSNQEYNDKRLEFNEEYRALKDGSKYPLTFGLFCKRINTFNNTKEKDIDGGLEGEKANKNVWFESLKQEAYSYNLLGGEGENEHKSFWGFSTYPYNYPLLGTHNHLLSFYNGFIGSAIDKLLSQMNENYLFEKIELFERDAIYGPLSKIQNGFLAEDLSFTFILDSIRYGFNHFKKYKNYLLTLEGESESIEEKRQLINEYLSRYYTGEEGFDIDEYLASITKSQKLSLINKFREDTLKRRSFYRNLINKSKPSINSKKIFENYKFIKNKIEEEKYDKILVVGVDEDTLERSNGTISIRVFLKDFVYKRKNTNEQVFPFNVNDFGETKIINADTYQDSIKSLSTTRSNNVLSEMCRDYLAIATGNSISDSDLFISDENTDFSLVEGPHYTQETSDLLSNNLPEINSFFQELNEIKNSITFNEEGFFVIQENFDYSNETDLYLYEKTAKNKIKKDIIKRLALFNYMIFSNDVIGRRCLLREFPRIFYIPINTKKFYKDDDQSSGLRLKNLGDISIEITME
tara:strand:- start:4409 stop:8878 length:4470 start_codon:yes stop_codon:yes gene_type:complete